MTIRAIILAAGLTLAPFAARAADTTVTHFPAAPLPDGSPRPLARL